MMDMLSCRSVYFLGIGGIGMSALARYFKLLGASVAGYDRTPTSLTGELQKEGMDIHFSEEISRIPADTDLVIYTPAIPKDHAELQYLQSRNIPLFKRAEVLGAVTRQSKTIAIAGTHGKTTTSTLVSHILVHAGFSVVGFLGGISKNYNTNLIISGKGGDPLKHANLLVPEFFVAEADEYDRSFLQLHPFAEVVTSVDADHLDIYGNLADMRSSFREFTSRIPSEGFLVMKQGIPLDPDNTHGYKVFTYSVEGKGDYNATSVRHEKEVYLFDMNTPGKMIRDILLGLPGRFNLENALASAAIALEAGAGEEAVRNALADYSGVRRRFDFRVKQSGCIYIDDYAHHPEELRASIGAARELYPDRHITGIFQPHLFTRTRDLADDFARSLGLLDRLILLEIYPAREKPIPGVNSSMILNKVRIQDKLLMTREEVLTWLGNNKTEVLMTLGAGDIDTLADPITELLTTSVRP